MPNLSSVTPPTFITPVLGETTTSLVAVAGIVIWWPAQVVYEAAAMPLIGSGARVDELQAWL